MTDKIADIATIDTTEQSLDELEAPSTDEAQLQVESEPSLNVELEHEVEEDLLNTSASTENSLRSSVEQERKLDSKLEADLRKELLVEKVRAKNTPASRRGIFFFKSATGRTVIDHFITLLAGAIRFFERFLFKEDMPIEPPVQVDVKGDDLFRLDPRKKKKKGSTKYVDQEDFTADPSDDPTPVE